MGGSRNGAQLLLLLLQVYLSLAANAVRLARSVADVSDIPRVAAGESREVAEGEAGEASDGGQLSLGNRQISFPSSATQVAPRPSRKRPTSRPGDGGGGGGGPEEGRASQYGRP